MEQIKIDLGIYRTPRSKVFTGRDRGISIRKESKLDYLINEGKNILIIIPDMIMSINPSFLEEFLFNAVRHLGKEKFKQRVTFRNNNPRYNFEEDLEEAIDRISRIDNALTKN